MVCSAWEGQRAGLELTNIEDLVKFFRKMLKEKERRGKDDDNGPTDVLGAARHDLYPDGGY